MTYSNSKHLFVESNLSSSKGYHFLEHAFKVNWIVLDFCKIFLFLHVGLITNYCNPNIAIVKWYAYKYSNMKSEKPMRLQKKFNETCILIQHDLDPKQKWGEVKNTVQIV